MGFWQKNKYFLLHNDHFEGSIVTAKFTYISPSMAG